MLELALIVLSILLFCGLPVGIPLGVCAIIEAVIVITLGIVKRLDGNK